MVPNLLVNKALSAVININNFLETMQLSTAVVNAYFFAQLATELSFPPRMESSHPWEGSREDGRMTMDRTA